MTDKEALARMLAEVLTPDPGKHGATNGLLSYKFSNGVRLSFLCGPSGRLNGVAIQNPDQGEAKKGEGR